jgi:hypothetical protein
LFPLKDTQIDLQAGINMNSEPVENNIQTIYHPEGRDCNSHATSYTDVQNQEESSMSDRDNLTLSEDTFSFLIVAPLFSIPFFTAIIVITIKATMYTLILADMMTKGTPNNVLGIPAALEVPVFVSQVLAVASTLIFCLLTHII